MRSQPATRAGITSAIEVAGDLHANLVGNLDSLEAGICSTLGQGRGDAGPVEPVGTLEHFAPVDHAGLDLGDGGVRTVVDDLGTAGDGARFEVIDADAVAAVDDAVGVHAEAAELGGAHRRDVILGETGHEVGIHAVVGEGNGDIGFAAAESCLEGMGLAETLVPGSGEPEHDFAESDYFCHICFLLDD